MSVGDLATRRFSKPPFCWVIVPLAALVHSTLRLSGQGDFAHEALVRSLNGEGARSILGQIEAVPFGLNHHSTMTFSRTTKGIVMDDRSPVGHCENEAAATKAANAIKGDVAVVKSGVTDDLYTATGLLALIGMAGSWWTMAMGYRSAEATYEPPLRRRY